LPVYAVEVNSGDDYWSQLLSEWSAAAQYNQAYGAVSSEALRMDVDRRLCLALQVCY